MNLHVSKNLAALFPELKEVLMDTTRCAKHRDKDIRTRNLFIMARCFSYQEEFAGTAHPSYYSYWRHRMIPHTDGKITMSIGLNCDQIDIVRLYAHELRHIGQFHRGQKRYGFMTCDPLSNQEAEYDAYDFEEIITERLL